MGRLMKQTYVSAMQRLAAVPPVAGMMRAARDADVYGWRRWAASLFAIYDTRSMVALDLPWWNVQATREIESFLAARPGARVFEYGAGASTAWLARRAAEVISVEHDAAFIGSFRQMLAPFANVTLLERSLDDGPDAYVGAITETAGEFDLIVVDGRNRAACLMASIARLAPRGVVLFDDSGRSRYRAAIDGCGLAETHHHGRSFCVPYPDHTSLLSRRG
jgi:hypothetical protein